MSFARFDDSPASYHQDELSPLLNKKNPLEGLEVESSLTTRIKSECGVLAETAIPTMQSMVLTKLPWIISLRFVGELGSEELAAAALATTLCNVTGMSFSVGLSFALSTLAGQAKGELLSRSSPRSNLSAEDDATAKHSYDRESLVEESPSEGAKDDLITPVVYLIRGLAVQLAVVIPIGIWWIYGIKDFLVYLGQSEVLAGMTEVRNGKLGRITHF